MNKLNFNHGWEMNHTSSAVEAVFMPPAWKPVNLPHDDMISKPRSADAPSGGATGFFPGGIINYRKKFNAPEEWLEKNIQIEFDGVYMNAEIRINDELVHFQPSGYQSFLVDLTPYLRIGQENILSVCANNSAPANSRWYSGTGIYRNVWLRTGGTTHIKPWSTIITTPVVNAESSVIQVSMALSASKEIVAPLSIRYKIVDQKGNEIARSDTSTRVLNIQETFLLKNIKLWSIDEPNLYTLSSEVWENDVIVDQEETTFGIRAISFDAENGFQLNGKTINLKGGCIHHDHGPLGAASFGRAEERKVELLKSVGYNALRSAHNPPSPALLDACDRLGVLVIDETFDVWTISKSPNDYHMHFKEWWRRDTEALIKRDRNHPSVIMWSIGNEIFEALGHAEGPALARQQANLVRHLDSTRPVISALINDIYEIIESGDMSKAFQLLPIPDEMEKDCWGLMTADFCKELDVVGYNYQPQRYELDAKKFPGRVIVGTETHGHWSYYYWKETQRLSHVIGDFIWVAMDFIGESGFGRVSLEGKPSMFAPYPYHLYGCGDLDICGVIRPQSYYRQLLWGARTDPFITVLNPDYYDKDVAFTPWSWEPVMESWTFPGQEGKKTRVDIYSIDDEVELMINNEVIGRKPAGDKVENKICFDVTYQPGTIEVVGYKDGKISGRHKIVTTSSAKKLCLTPDQKEICADTNSIAYIDITVLDVNGLIVKHEEPEIEVEVSGEGELIAIGTGNPESEEMYVGSHRKAYEGHLLAVVRSNGKKGEIHIKTCLSKTAQFETKIQAL